MSLPSFEIHDKEGEAVYINKLDEEATIFWGKEVHPKDYAYPQHKPEKFASYKEELDFWRHKENWFDKIGWRIAQSENPTWESLRAEILEPFKEYDQDMIMDMPEIGGFIKLIDYWASKGYIPVSVKN